MIPSGPESLLLFILLFFPVTSSSNASNHGKSSAKSGSEVQTSLSLGGHRCKTSHVFSCHDLPFSEHSFCSPGLSKAPWAVKQFSSF